MTIELSLPAILFVAILYGATMKLADLLDEHGLHWFKGDAMLFGLLWGILGSLLIVADNQLANVLLAQMLAYVLRLSLDYRNHAIAATLMILVFVATSTLMWPLFLTFLAIFTLLGALRDSVGKTYPKRDWWFHFNEVAWYYFLPPLIWSALTGDWLIVAVLALYRISYDLVKYGLYWRGAYKQL